MIPIVPKTRETRSNNVTFYESSASPPGTASPGLSEPRKKGSDPFFFLLGDANLVKYNFYDFFLIKRKKKRNSATHVLEDTYTPYLLWHLP